MSKPKATTTTLHRAGSASAEWDFPSGWRFSLRNSWAPTLILRSSSDVEAWRLTERELADLLEVLRAAVAEEEARRPGASVPVAQADSVTLALEEERR